MGKARWTWAALVVLGACSDPPATKSGSDDGQDQTDDASDQSDSSDDTEEDEDEDDPSDGSDADESQDDDGDEGCPALATNAVLSGSVLAPNLEIPISGALVYLTRSDVAPIADGTYCSQCVELACDEPYTLTKPDGSFELAAVAGTGLKLVVQKGEFRRVVSLDVAEGSQAIATDQSNLPGRWDPEAGMWIPRVAIYQADPDAVFNVLAKFGMADVDSAGEYVSGTEQFTLIADDDGAFLENFEEMSRYHIIFVPCASTKYWTGAPIVSSQRIDNVREFVAAGGKWYATDHSNEYIAEPFPTYQDFHSSATWGLDLQPAYDSTGSVVDEGLLAWMEALPAGVKNSAGLGAEFDALPAITTHLNYSGIDAIHDVMVEDDEGMPVNVGHHAYVEGPCMSCSDAQVSRPMAVSGQYGCGRMMYSTFETSSVAHVGMTPQELVLLYMILEISVCHQEPPVEPPPL